MPVTKPLPPAQVVGPGYDLIPTFPPAPFSYPGDVPGLNLELGTSMLMAPPVVVVPAALSLQAAESGSLALASAPASSASLGPAETRTLGLPPESA